MNNIERRYAVEKQTVEGVWWQNYGRYEAYDDAVRKVKDLLKYNAHTYKDARVVDTHLAGYVDDALPVDY